MFRSAAELRSRHTSRNWDADAIISYYSHPKRFTTLLYIRTDLIIFYVSNLSQYIVIDCLQCNHPCLQLSNSGLSREPSRILSYSLRFSTVRSQARQPCDQPLDLPDVVFDLPNNLRSGTKLRKWMRCVLFFVLANVLPYQVWGSRSPKEYGYSICILSANAFAHFSSWAQMHLRTFFLGRPCPLDLVWQGKKSPFALFSTWAHMHLILL
jgi:hypothetical protein